MPAKMMGAIWLPVVVYILMYGEMIYKNDVIVDHEPNNELW